MDPLRRSCRHLRAKVRPFEAVLLLAASLASACASEPSGSPTGGASATGGGGQGGSTETSTTSSTTTTDTGTGGTGNGGASTTATAGSAGSAPCEPPVSADHPAETEPNDSPATANVLAPPAKGFAASLCPAGDVDIFSVTLLGGESLSVRVTDGDAGCPASALPDVTIFDPQGQPLAADTGFGCLTLGPQLHPSLAALPPGTYDVRVSNFAPSQVASYAVDIAAQPPTCGDGIVQLPDGEQCDDANTAAGDGCSASCQLEGDFVNEVEPNDLQSSATPLSGAQGAVGALSSPGDVDYYSFQIPTDGSSVSALVSDGLGGCPYGFDSAITILDANGLPHGYADDGGVEKCSFLDPVLVPAATGLLAGTYFITVQSAAFLSQPSYVLTVEVHPPGCGDAVVSPPEQCDDANSASGDGCSSTCKSESPWEIEPNDDQLHATPLWPGAKEWRAQLHPSGDHDWFSFTVPQGANVTLSTSNLGNMGACDIDSVLHLVNAQGTQIGTDNDSGVNACSKLSPAAHPEVANMPAGTYYVWVEDISETPLIARYELLIDIQ